MKIETYKYKALELFLYQTPASKSPRLKKYLEAALPVFASFLKPYSKAQAELSLTLCGKAKIQKLNKEYRAKDKVTDVLSFPLYNGLRMGKEKDPFLSLGDIFICHEVARRQAKSFELTYEDEIVHLLAHGFLHLLGFDHELSAKEDKLMRGLEEKLVKKISKNLKKK